MKKDWKKNLPPVITFIFYTVWLVLSAFAWAVLPARLTEKYKHWFLR